MTNPRKFTSIGCCGISCGLCPRFHSKAKSRCLGCGPDAHCSFCSIFRCCQIKRNYETCADCNEFPCEKFGKWFDADSFVTHSNCLINIQKIQNIGIKEFLKEQSERKNLLESILKKYNTGRLMSFYCLASSLLSIESLRKALKQIEPIRENKAKSFELIVKEFAKSENVVLKLRK
jgi:hypothetical protein